MTEVKTEWQFGVLDREVYWQNREIPLTLYYHHGFYCSSIQICT
jgi:hypothetical protein